MLSNRQDTIFSVQAITEYLRELLRTDFYCQSIYIRGEITNLSSRNAKGHLYFSLKDDKATIKAVMFANETAHLSFTPHEGDSVVILGRIDIYAARGEYQVYVTEMELDGQGLALLKLEELKKKLYLEGLFDEGRKRPLPSFPQAIGLVTANHSAALKDLVVNISNRYPIVKLYLFPALVQGEEAPQSLIRALKKAYQRPLDCLIIGRGGGANDDLSAFNNEELVRTIYQSPFPIVSAVGHEINTTLCDLVADLRVSTPTAAAERVVPKRLDLLQMIDEDEERLETAMIAYLNYQKDRLSKWKEHIYFRDPRVLYQEKAKDLEVIRMRLTTAYQAIMAERDNEVQILKAQFYQSSREEKFRYQRRLEQYQTRLAVLHPEAPLERGYSIIANAEGRVVESIDQVAVGESLRITVKDGIMIGNVTAKEKKDE